MATFPTNRTLTITRKGSPIVTVDAHLEPASTETKAILGNPAANLFNVYIYGLPDVAKQDHLIVTDTAEQYLVTGVEQYDVALARHTHLTVEGKWGT